MNLLEDILNQVNSKLKKDKITNKELASRMECKESYISNLLNGKNRNPKIETLINLIHCSGLSFNNIFLVENKI